MRILPEEEDFDPESFDAEARAVAIREGHEHFNAERFHEAHEAFERCWLAGEGADSDLWKGSSRPRSRSTTCSGRTSPALAS